MRRILGLWLSFALALLVCAPVPARTPAEEAYEIGMEAYVYLYPLVTMDVSRRQLTNIEAGKMTGRGPMNTFTHIRAYPTADFREVVRPNFDTLYSSAWLDLRQQPVIVSVPDTAGRYYLLPMLDMWTDVFAAPGKRTSGTAAASYALVGPGWHGRLPQGVTKIQAPTPYVWIIGRTQTNGAQDYEAVHQIQDGIRATPLSGWGKPAAAAPFVADPTVDMKTPPLQQVIHMPAAQYFAYAAELLKVNPPHATDWSTLERLKRIGLGSAKSFVWEQQDPAVQEALTRAATDARKAMYAKAPTMARVVNGWQMNTDTMGVYGNYYLKRAIVAMMGLGANQPEDAVYPIGVTDAAGQPFKGGANYVLHFDKAALPPADAFWSLTMYDQEGFPIANALNRFAIGDRDALKFNADGSLDIYIQHQNPGTDKEANWLPSPASGTLGLTMRLYAPRMPALDGRWSPPAIQRVSNDSEPLPQ